MQMALHGRTSGFIIFPVLWLLAAVATLATVYAVYVNVTAFSLTEYKSRLEEQELANAGVELAVYRLTAIQRDQERPPTGSFRFQLGRGSAMVEFRSENGRLDLNFAPRELLIGLFASLGSTRFEAEAYADRIIAWRTPSNADGGDTETLLYKESGKSYGPRRGPFQNVEELTLIPAIPPNVIRSTLPYLTVYSGQAEVNAYAASQQVLAALPGMTPERIRILLSQRANVSQDVLNSQLGVGVQYVTSQSSKVNRVVVEVLLNNRRTITTALVMLQQGSEPFRVMSWQETNDGNIR